MKVKRGTSGKNLAIIPARSGSKRIPDKNVRDFCGKPLIYYPISIALESGLFDRVIVDTDSRKIAEIGEKFGAQVPYLRPKNLAQDTSSVIDAVLLLLSRLKKDGYVPNTICLLQATSPLREFEDILNCYELLKKPGIESVCTICESHPRFYHLKKDGRLILVNREVENKTNIQQVPMGYMLNGCTVYVIKTSAFMREKKLVHDGTYAVVCPKWRSVDLDEIEDWVHAEFLYKNRGLIKRGIKSFK